MSAKQDALVEVVEIIRRHELTLDEITAALGNKPAFKRVRYGGVLSRLFGYIGGIFVFAGLAIYVGMRWDHLGALGHILLTLGVGFSVFLLAIVCTTDARVERASTCSFSSLPCSSQPVVFGLGFFTIAFDLLHVEHHLIGVVIGMSLVSIAWSIDHSRHKGLSTSSSRCERFWPPWTLGDSTCLQKSSGLWTVQCRTQPRRPPLRFLHKRRSSTGRLYDGYGVSATAPRGLSASPPASASGSRRGR